MWRQLIGDGFLVGVLASFSIGVSVFYRDIDRDIPPESLSIAQNTKSVPQDQEMDPLPASLLVSSTGRSIPHPPLSLERFKKYIDWGNGVIIDVRTEEKYKRGHIPGAISLPAGKFESVYPGLERDLEPFLDRLIVIYCSNKYCGSGDLAQQHLIRHGYKFVGNYVGGYQEWEAAKEPVEVCP